MSNHIPAGAGAFSVVNGKAMIRGKVRRTRVLVFTTHDGYVGESRLFKHREAYEAAVAARASAQFAARQASITALPSSRPCDKPAPAVQLLHALKDTILFSEVERRGYEVSIA